MPKFWDYIHDDSGGRVLRLEGLIDSDSFWGDEITPQDFRDELYAEDGDLTLWINSPGGNVFAAAEIYTMIRDYPHNVTVRIASIAASAASVIAMAGNTVQMSPTALLMIHDPSTIAFGNAKDMEKAIATLNEVKESIINAYAAKTGLSRNRISKLMSDETWINAKKAVELGFADEILFDEKPTPDKKEDDPDDPDEPDKPDQEGGDDEGDEKKETEKKPFKLDTGDALWEYSTRVMGQTILGKITASAVPEGTEPSDDSKTDDAQKPSEEGLTAPTVTVPDMPVIGMDGKTADGSMPYEILKQQLAFLR
ncbi:head maturation protease, ClpP-related [Ruminococcus sp. XPD3002]|uniref:head maturation protease, ClpP-related n=1 Tax=Ruminococcus sp. XPD3002 TaxID=1452269 RepID=UPI0009143502|nr:ATP-dependent protease ClpP, protease subunit [Ruminococcus flavefaciens]